MKGQTIFVHYTNTPGAQLHLKQVGYERNPKPRCGVYSTNAAIRETVVSEAELVERVLAGNQQAWATLVQEQQEAVFRLAFLLLGDADEAEDVAQDVFVRAARGLARFDRTRPLRPWLLQITRNLAANRKRSARRYWAALGRWWHTAAPAQAAAQAAPQMDADAAALHQALGRLSAQDQEVIYLRYFLELSVDETAQALGVAPGTVKSRLARALGRLRPLMQEALEVDGEFVDG
jgi:RNA polymerase sigma-70 factor (ECF subfamily)